MMGSDSIDISLGNIWRSWFRFRKGKNVTNELHKFQYFLEENLYRLHQDLVDGTYYHGGYKKFVVDDNKRREIFVASIRDRVVHRLVYDFLTVLYDKTFIYDAWSCRLGKGLLGAIQRTQVFLNRLPKSFVWRGDVTKFFDSVDQKILLEILTRRVKDMKTYNLIKEIIESFSVDRKRRGIPIGNLTSQIFANIYLNEFDRFVKHTLKPQEYLRYGDDFIIIHNNLRTIVELRESAVDFLKKVLGLRMHPKNDKIFKTRHGLRFLGVVVWPHGHRLKKRNVRRITVRLNRMNAASYRGLVIHHGSKRLVRFFHWLIEQVVFL